MKYEEGQRVRVLWLDDPSRRAPIGAVKKVSPHVVTVEFDEAPRNGLDKVQKFTLRKTGEFIAADWHWVYGVPGLRAI